MKKLLDTLSFVVFVAVLVVFLVMFGALSYAPRQIVSAQSYGALSYAVIAPSVAQCPPGSTGATSLCTVNTGTSSAPAYVIYVSFNAGAYAPLSAGLPAGVVTSFNGRPGPAILLTKGDVTGTGIAVTVSAPTATVSAPVATIQ